MQIGHYSVRVVAVTDEGHEIAGHAGGAVEQHDGYVEIPHGTHYAVALHNRNSLRCDARVEIDGKSVGLFRLDPASRRGAARIEHPDGDQGRFTFYAVDSAAGKAIGAAAGVPSNGLIQVTFRPERHVPPAWYQGTAVQDSGYDYDVGSIHNLTVGASSGGVTYRAPSGGVRVRSVTSSAPGDYVRTGSRTYGEGKTGLEGHSDQEYHTVAALDYDYERFVTISLRLVVPRGAPVTAPAVNRGNPVPPPVQRGPRPL